MDDASFSYAGSPFCADDVDPTPTVTGQAGGSFSSTAGLVINSTTGQIDLDASVAGTYNVTYSTDAAGNCINTSIQSVTINALDDASFSYAGSPFCADDVDPTPTVTGQAGGSFSSTAGLVINSTTGQIDLDASVAGTYNVTYSTDAAGTCINTSIQSVTINALDDASFSYAGSPFCADDVDPTPTVTGQAGGSFSSTAGLVINSTTGQIDLDASVAGTYNVTYSTDAAGTCINTSIQSVTINALDDASFSYAGSPFCADDVDPTPTVTGQAGGSFSSTAGLVINSTTGQIDLDASVAGTYNVTYSTDAAGTCINTSIQSVTINALDDASFSYAGSPFCADDVDPTPTVTGQAGGSFSSTAGLVINSTTGQIDLDASVAGTYNVTYSTDAAGTCINTSIQSVTINALDDASFSYAGSPFCADDVDPTPTVTGQAGGSFSSTAGLVINSTTGQIDLDASVAGTYNVTYSTDAAGTCINTSIQSVTINALPVAVLIDTNGVICNAGNDGEAVIQISGGSITLRHFLDWVDSIWLYLCIFN